METAKTILIVDDAEDNRVVFGEFLEHIGYRVVEAGDGWEGIEQARQEHPDLILMDVSMPRLDGIEATRLLRADPDTASIPVLMVTAHTDAGTRKQACECGCSGFLGKPVRPSQLAGEVERLLRPGPE